VSSSLEPVIVRANSMADSYGCSSASPFEYFTTGIASATIFAIF